MTTALAQVIVVTGSRHATSEPLVSGALSVLRHTLPGAVLYAGDAPGADHLFTVTWAHLHERRTVAAAIAEGLVIQFRADWEAPCTPACGSGHRRPRPGGGTYCPAAGPRRNDTMCAAAAAAGVPVTTVALWKLGGFNSGTSSCVAAMRRHGLPFPVPLIEGRST